MLDFYRTMEELNPNHQNMAVTILEGEWQGAKALLSGDKVIWQTACCSFFEENREKIVKIHGEGIWRIGGSTLFCELLGHEKKIVICGAGHVSIPVIRMGLMIGCHVTVLEDRPKFADDARWAGAQEVLCEPFEQGIARIEGDGDTFFVIVTRGHRYDQICLEAAVRKPHAYIGMIGSRRRVAMVKTSIIENGADPDIVNSVHSPIGLDIGAETPEEIAVSIIAEIIEVKNRQRHSGYPRELLRAILSGSETDRRVLATIVRRAGSAPRQVGTKMLIQPDGTCVGTIGGGCAEAEVLREALYMLHGEDSAPRLHRVDLTGQDAEDEGMVCGGVIDVLLETI